jgi:hypothetical protein
MVPMACHVSLGTLVSSPVLNALIQQRSWHVAFGVLAAVGAVVALAWAVLGRDRSITEDEGAGVAVPPGAGREVRGCRPGSPSGGCRPPERWSA